MKLWIRAHRLWLILIAMGVVQILALIVGGAALLTLGTRIGHEQSVRIAKDRAEAQAKVTVCRRAVITAPGTLKLAAAIDLIFANQIKTTKGALETAPNDTLVQVRRRSLQRYQDGRAILTHYIRQIHRSTPTTHQCDKLAVSLGLKPAGAE